MEVLSSGLESTSSLNEHNGSRGARGPSPARPKSVPLVATGTPLQGTELVRSLTMAESDITEAGKRFSLMADSSSNLKDVLEESGSKYVR